MRTRRWVAQADLVVAVYDAASALRRLGDAEADVAGQTQARWQVMNVAAHGRWTVPQIARRLGVQRQSVQANRRSGAPGRRAEPGWGCARASRWWAITIDSIEPRRLAGFWSDLFGCGVVGPERIALVGCACSHLARTDPS